MKKTFFLIFLFLIACTKNSSSVNYNKDLNFFNQLTLEQFKIKLENYANNKPYPNIDE
jgi:hypothetical protein